MKTLSLSEVKMKLSGLVEAVQATDEEIVITKNGKPAAVLVSPDEFESWRETNAVRSDSGPNGRNTVRAESAEGKENTALYPGGVADRSWKQSRLIDGDCCLQTAGTRRGRREYPGDASPFKKENQGFLKNSPGRSGGGETAQRGAERTHELPGQPIPDYLPGKKIHH